MYYYYAYSGYFEYKGVEIVARFNLEVKSYSLNVARRWDASGGGQPIYGPAYIVCNLADGYDLVVYFLDPASPQVANTVYLPSKRVTIFAPIDRYAMFVDILRNEKPVYASFNSDHPEWNALTTSNEPVGEQEVVHV